MGDPNGIGPEVVLKTLMDSRILKYIDPIVVGSMAVMRRYASLVPMPAEQIREVRDLADTAPAQTGIRVYDPFAGQEPHIRLLEFGQALFCLGQLGFVILDLLIEEFRRAIVDIRQRNQRGCRHLHFFKHALLNQSVDDTHA